MVLDVVAEHNLPLTMAPALIDLAKELAKDKKALDNLSMDRTTASYRIRHGLSKTFLEETINNIRSSPFSLNIDESTSNSNKRVLAILVSYYSEKNEKVLLEHLASIEVVKVDSESLYNVILDLFDKYDIPWSNLISILMDSCAVMRGSKSGLETRIRQNKAPHLLNIDGDICHHVHNTCKKFCEPFQYWVESLFGDLYNDIKCSPDLSERLSEVCEILGISHTNPEHFVNHRWLSVYDLSVSTLRIIDVLQIFYFGFIPQGSQQDYRGILIDIYRKYNVSIEARERIREVIDTVKEKKLTEDGRNRKLRIVDKVMFNEKKTKLILNFYQSALLLLKSYVCLFQSKEPLIHVVHDKLEELFQNFLACFVKPEKIPKSSVQLKQMNLDDENIYLKTSEVFIGHSAKKIIKAARQDDSTNMFFLRNVMQAYTSSAVYIQKKFPLNNKLLKCVSTIDPSARGHSKTAEALRNLKDMVPLISDDEKEKYDLEVQQLQIKNEILIS
ncbi:uncharacterized protein LOC132889689 [Neoarius graeffei]|uniref:uncharacterized protein LOC132889689 n=1 Tax=Neoarius graeffei TaxID=443677 RepID=UPI00298CEFC3|nr:uncharacterized protein LOC132889689 [Neoarius graeffei]